MPQYYLFLIILPAAIGYRPEDHHHHHVRHHHRDDTARHGSLDDILRRLDNHHPKKDDVLSIDAASKQLQKAMDDYRKSIDAVKKHRAPWEDDSEKVDEWSTDPSSDDKSGGVDDAFDNYDSNGVELDDDEPEMGASQVSFGTYSGTFSIVLEHFPGDCEGMLGALQLSSMLKMF